MNWYKSIGVKIILSVVGMILIVNGTLAYKFLGIQRENLNHAILRTASQLSETIKKSIQNDMLENRKEAAYKIMETIGRQEGIEKVRVYSSEGKIRLRKPVDRLCIGRELNPLVANARNDHVGCHAQLDQLGDVRLAQRSGGGRTNSDKTHPRNRDKQPQTRHCKTL